MSSNFKKIIEQFPILDKKESGGNLVYLDNASTTQKPLRVIEKESEFYKKMNANIHRGVYKLSEEATAEYTKAHQLAADFINADSFEEIVFTKNSTESLNLLAMSLTRKMKSKDRILLSVMEHHSNLVPWQMIAKEKDLILDFVEIDDQGKLDMNDLERKLKLHPKIMSITQMSNVLGTINPVKEISRLAHQAGALVIVDAAQSAARMPVNVKDLDVDFMTFSSHKMYGPTGVGILFGKKQLLEKMEPVLFGGDMVKEVSFSSASWNDLPWKFEAGTPNIAGGVAFSEAIKFIEEVGMEKIREHELELNGYMISKLQSNKNINFLGPIEAKERGGVFSFVVKGVHSHDLASLMDEKGIAIRGGNHCAQPLLNYLGINECPRVSFGITTTKQEIDYFWDSFVAAIKKIGGRL